MSMNRIEQIAPYSELIPGESGIAVDLTTFQDVASSECVSFLPLHYEPGYAYPLFVWLHGPRDNEHQLKRIMPLVSTRNYVAVAPRGTVKAAPSGQKAQSYTWPVSAAGVDEVEQRIFEAIDLAFDKAHIAADRIFLAGMAEGGTAAIRVALRYPDKFAGVLSLGGPVPSGDAPLCRLTEARQLPLLLACGQNAPNYPSERICNDLRLFHAAGMSVDLRLYPGGDEMTPTMLADANRWMMQRITAEQATSVCARNR